jgi:hypothetical protein
MIIGLSGYAQTGKDTAAMHLVSTYGFKRIAFADPLREALYRLNPVVSDVPEVPGIHLASAVDNLGWELVKQTSPQVREMLQRMGTEVGRGMFGTDFWVNQAFKNVYRGSQVVFTDVRFPNEFEKIKSYNGKVFRVVKDGVKAVNRHNSETALDNFTFDGVILNNGSIEELYKQIDSLIPTL